MLKISFDKKEVDLNMQSLSNAVLKRCRLDNINNIKSLIINDNNYIDYETSLIAIKNIESVIDALNECYPYLFFEELSKYLDKLGNVYYNQQLHFSVPENGDVTEFMHISNGYIDLDISHLNDNTLSSFYISSLVINDNKYPELKLITKDKLEFNKRLNLTNKSTDKYPNYTIIVWEN